MYAGRFGMLAAAAHVSTCMPWKLTGLTTDSGSCVTATSPEIDHTWPSLDRYRNRAAELDLEVAIPLLRRGDWLGVVVGRQVQPRMKGSRQSAASAVPGGGCMVWSHSVRPGLHVVEVLYVSPEMIATRASDPQALSDFQGAQGITADPRSEVDCRRCPLLRVRFLEPVRLGFGARLILKKLGRQAATLPVEVISSYSVMQFRKNRVRSARTASDEHFQFFPVAVHGLVHSRC